ncbi:MAG: DUF4382 domain-containing protein [Cyclobacteriaceae bacterium]|nr:DUF4382 domain-containing protein [Cyclobacteriaceae bacterium]
MNKFKKVLNSFLILPGILPIVFLVQGCTQAEDIPANSRLKLALVDSPADYEAVNVDIQEISLKTTGTEENNGWINLEGFLPGIYNILEFTGGRELLLADMDFPAGSITQLKMKIGKNNSLIMNGHTSYLLNANDTESGLLMNVDVDIRPGTSNSFKLDFDASRSVTGLGNTGQMLIKPVLRLFSEENTGSIIGKVLPAGHNVLISVLVNNKIIASSYANKEVSTFMVAGLDAGIYRVSMVISDDIEQIFVDNIKVVKGRTTDMGTINWYD